MRKMILSFSYEWYAQLKSGEKIYEHRKRFCKEPVEAYILDCHIDNWLRLLN